MNRLRLFLITLCIALISACGTNTAMLPTVTSQTMNQTTSATLVNNASQPGSSLQMTPTSIPNFGRYLFPQITPDPRCMPPCFYNVVPGKTTISETLSSLRATRNQVIDNQLTWSVTPAPLRLPSNFIAFQENTAVAIVINEPFTVSLEDVIVKYGVPESVVIGWPSADLAVDDIVLAYPTRGIAFLSSETRPNSPDERYIPKPEMPVLGLIYFEPHKVEALSAKDTWLWLITDGLKFRQWRGFGVSIYEP